MPRKQRSVLVVDDDEMARAVVMHLIRREPGFRVRAAAADGGEALALIDEECPDLIVLDQEMPGRLGLEVLPDLRHRCPQARIVLWSLDPAVEALVAAAGGDGFVNKSEPLDRLLDWLRAA